MLIRADVAISVVLSSAESTRRSRMYINAPARHGGKSFGWPCSAMNPPQVSLHSPTGLRTEGRLRLCSPTMTLTVTNDGGRTCAGLYKPTGFTGDGRYIYSYQPADVSQAVRYLYYSVFYPGYWVLSTVRVKKNTPHARLIERCSDGVEDQGAEEALWGRMPRENGRVSFGSRLPCERLSFLSARFSAESIPTEREKGSEIHGFEFIDKATKKVAEKRWCSPLFPCRTSTRSPSGGTRRTTP